MSVLKRYNGASWEIVGPQISSTRFDDTNHMIAPEYSPNDLYNVGDYVVKNDKLYKCTNAIESKEEWTEAHWNQVSISEEISDLDHIYKTVKSMVHGGFIYNAVSGTTANFDDGADGMLIKSLVVDIKPTQELNGNEPSYQNICPITGWTGVTISHSGADTSNPETLSVSWQSSAGTVYGGSINVVSGELIITLKGKHFSDLTWTKNANLTYGFNGAGFPDRKKRILSYDNPDCYCDTYPWYNANNPNGLTNDISSGIALSNSNNNIYTYVIDNRFSTLANFTASFATHDPFFVVPLEEPLKVQLTPQEIECFLGVNNIWANTGDVTVIYPVDTKTYIDRKIQEAINGLSGS